MPHRASSSLQKSLPCCGIILARALGQAGACLDLASVHAGGMTLSFLSSHYIQSARFGALSRYVEPYITLVLNRGYKPATIVGQLRLIARLNRWFLRMDYDLGRLDERVLEHFQKCEQKRRRAPSAGARVTLQRFLAVLRDARVAPPAAGMLSSANGL